MRLATSNRLTISSSGACQGPALMFAPQLGSLVQQGLQLEGCAGNCGSILHQVLLAASLLASLHSQLLRATCT